LSRTNAEHERADGAEVEHEPANVMKLAATVEQMRRGAAEVERERDELQDEQRVVQRRQILQREFHVVNVRSGLSLA